MRAFWFAVGVKDHQAKKEGQIKLLPLFKSDHESFCEGSREKESSNSRQSAAFDCLRLSFFLLLKIRPGGGSSFRTRASPRGILLIFIFAMALNGVFSLPSFRCPLRCPHGEKSSLRHQSRR